jgi:hypothetical protein
MGNSYIPPIDRTTTVEPKDAEYICSGDAFGAVSGENWQIIARTKHTICFVDPNGQRHYFKEKNT